MITLESCKGCGGSKFEVEKKSGYDFLICSSCGNYLAILDEKGKGLDLPDNYVSYSGAYIKELKFDNTIVCSGYPLPDAMLRIKY